MRLFACRLSAASVEMFAMSQITPHQVVPEGARLRCRIRESSFNPNVRFSRQVNFEDSFNLAGAATKDNTRCDRNTASCSECVTKTRSCRSASDLQQFDVERVTHEFVQCAERFVHQQDSRPRNQCACNCHSLRIPPDSTVGFASANPSRSTSRRASKASIDVPEL